jgi:hypothetical protein
VTGHAGDENFPAVRQAGLQGFQTGGTLLEETPNRPRRKRQGTMPAPSAIRTAFLWMQWIFMPGKEFM